MFSKKCIGQHVSGRQFVSVATGRRHVLRDVVIEDCEFNSFLLGKTDFDLRKRGHELRNVRVVNCRLGNCMIKFAVLEQVSLVSCTAPEGGLRLWKCLLREVSINGDFETLAVIPPDDDVYAPENFGDSSYAVDVRYARCHEVELIGIPAGLVKYDSATGGTLRRSILQAEGWPSNRVSQYFGGIMEKFRLYGGDSSVYVVPVAARDAAALLDELASLKDRGWVE